MMFNKSIKIFTECLQNIILYALGMGILSPGNGIVYFRLYFYLTNDGSSVHIYLMNAYIKL